MALSEEKRNDRQQKLLRAAEQLMRTSGDAAGFSMAQLAIAGGVSPATPYNLLGTKSDILAMIVRAEFARFEARLTALPPTDPLDRLRRAIAEVVRQYASDRAFYLGLYRSTASVEDNAVRQRMLSEGHTLWEELVSAAAAVGQLAPWVRVPPLTELLLRQMSITTQAWLAEHWHEDRFAAEMAQAVTFLLATAVTDERRPELIAEAAALQTRVDALMREAVERRSSPDAVANDP